jgi:DNA-binding MarR family transcriptional regulator
MPNRIDAILMKEMANELLQMQTLSAATRSRSRKKGAADLTETEFLTLDLLTKTAILTVGEIQRQIGVLPAQMSRVVRALEKRTGGPLIKCKINRTDKRKIDIEITKIGRQLHKNYQEVRLQGMMDFLEVLTKEDCREFMRICRIIRGQIESILMH